MQREYNIPRDTLLWEYTWSDIQDMMYLIPLDRLVQVVPGMKPEEAKKRYIECFCDPLSNQQISQQLDTKYDQFEKRLAELKQKGA